MRHDFLLKEIGPETKNSDFVKILILCFFSYKFRNYLAFKKNTYPPSGNTTRRWNFFLNVNKFPELIDSSVVKRDENNTVYYDAHPDVILHPRKEKGKIKIVLASMIPFMCFSETV